MRIATIHIQNASATELLVSLLQSDPAASSSEATRISSQDSLFRTLNDQDSIEFVVLVPLGFEVYRNPLANVNSERVEPNWVRLVNSIGLQTIKPVLLAKTELLSRLKSSTLFEVLEQQLLQDYQGGELAQFALRALSHPEERLRVAANELIGLDASDPSNALRRAILFETLHRPQESFSSYGAVLDQSESSDLEKWIAAMRLAFLHAHYAHVGVGKSASNHRVALEHCETAFFLRQDRPEPLVIMAQIVRENGEAERAFQLMQIAKELSLQSYDDQCFYDDFVQARHAEHFLCALAVGDDAEVIESANAFLVQSYLGKFEPELESKMIAARNEALERTRKSYPSQPSKRNEFLVIIPFYNAGELLRDCVNSVLNQNYDRFSVQLIDDASDDPTTIELAQELALNSRVTLKRNESNQGPLHNQINALSECANPNTIAVFVDGDDRLAHDDVLSYLDAAYHSTGCWVTYGQWQSMQTGRQGFARPFSPNESLNDMYRNGSLVFPIHPRSHRVGLFHRYQEIDPSLSRLRNRRGDLFRSASDLAHMRVMMQLAGHARCLYIAQVLYLYNEGNLESHHIKDRQGLFDDAQDVGGAANLATLSSYLPASQGMVSNEAQESATQQVSRSPARVIVLALDGACPIKLRAMVAAGEMPTFASMFSHYDAITPYPSGNSTSFWRGVFAGEKLGGSPALYREFTTPYGTFDAVRHHHAYLTIDGFWNELGYQNYKVAALNPPDVSFQQSTPNVTWVSDWLLHTPQSGFKTDPPQLERVIRETTKELSGLGQGTEVFEARTKAQNDELLDRLLARNKDKTTVYKGLLGHGDWDLFLCAYDSIHDGAHQLYGASSAEATSASMQDQLYKDLDQQLSELLQDCSNAEVYAIAGLGSKRNSSQQSMAQELMEKILKGLSIRYSGPCFRMLPYTPNAALFQFLVEGRDSAGVIPANDLEDIMQRVSEQWLLLKGEQTGDSVVAQVVRQREQGSTEPFSSTLADLAVVWGDFDLAEPYSSDLVKSQSYRPNPGNIFDARKGDHSTACGIFSNVPQQPPLGADGCVDIESLHSFLKHRVKQTPPQL